MTSTNITLREGEQLIVDVDEIIYRQVTRHLFDGEKVATTAFGPSTADNGMPSYSRSSVVSAQESRDWHTKNARSPSLGVWGLSVRETIETGLHAIDDSQSALEDGMVRAPGHCFVDFRGLTKAQIRTLRARLYFHAVRRGEIETTETLQDGQLFA